MRSKKNSLDSLAIAIIHHICEPVISYLSAKVKGINADFTERDIAMNLLIILSKHLKQSKTNRLRRNKTIARFDLLLLSSLLNSSDSLRVEYSEEQWLKVTQDTSPQKDFGAIDLVLIQLGEENRHQSFELGLTYRKCGFHVCFYGDYVEQHPEEVSRYCDTILLGRYYNVFEALITDFRNHRARRLYIGRDFGVNQIMHTSANLMHFV